MKSSKVLLGVLAGLAAGAAIGILFAPDKGSKTRKQILSKGGEYADSLKDKFDDLVDMVTKSADSTGQQEDHASKEKSKQHETKKDFSHTNA
jgi:gas vesicle protein